MTHSPMRGAVNRPGPGLLRPISDAERADYARDGAAIVRGVIPPDWVAILREAVTRLLDRPDLPAQNYAEDGAPRFFSLAFAWLFDEDLKAWAVAGPMVEIARQVMSEAKSVTFFYDQVFVKEPGATTATPWHQDLSFLPVAGEQQIRLWVPLDTVTADSGAIHYLRGSHRWDVVYRPVGFKDIPVITEAYADSPYTDPPDFGADYDSYDWLVAEAEPGDVLLHHTRTVHGSLGNRTGRYRRAITSFYVGELATWDPHPGNMFDNPSLTGHVRMPDLPSGARLAGDLFPRVWPR